MWRLFRDEALDQRASPRLDQRGLYGGEQSLEWFRAWQFHDFRTLDVFGAPWVELPGWLRHDLLVCIGNLEWHRANAKLPTPTMSTLKNPFGEAE